MELTVYLRHVFSERIRPAYIKEKCECCGSESNLHLHHDDKRMKDMIPEVLAVFDFPLKDTDDYEEDELLKIKHYFIGMSHCITYKTLCEKCHIKLHKKEAQDFSKMKEKIKRERKDSERIKKAENKKECEKAKRILLLEKYIGEKMDVEDLRVLIRSLGFKKDKKGNIYKKLEDVIRFINELGYNIEYHEDKKYCWTHKYYLIIKI